MPKPERYDLKTNVPIDVRLGKIYQNEGQHGPFIRVLAWIREPTEADYTYRSFLSNMELLGQFYQLEFARDEDKMNDDGLPYVETLKDGDADVLRIVLAEDKNPRTGKRFTTARITHYWDGEVWQEAPERTAAPPNDPPPPSAGPPAAAGPPSAAPQAPAPDAAPAAPAAPPQPATGGREPKRHPVEIGFNYHLARCLVIAAGVGRDNAHEATTTVFIELMKNGQVQAPTEWYKHRFQEARTEAGDDGLPF